MSAKTLGVFTEETALQTALQLGNGKSTSKLPVLDARSRQSSATRGSLQTHLHVGANSKNSSSNDNKKPVGFLSANGVHISFLKVVVCRKMMTLRGTSRFQVGKEGGYGCES